MPNLCAINLNALSSQNVVHFRLLQILTFHIFDQSLNIDIFWWGRNIFMGLLAQDGKAFRILRATN